MAAPAAAGDISIERATPADAAAAAEVHAITVRHAYEGIFPASAPAPSASDLEAEWASAIGDAATVVLAAIAGSGSACTVIGTVRIDAHPTSDGEGRLTRLHVTPARWGCGVGGMLHHAAVDELRHQGWSAASLWVLEQNARARRFYERRGWLRVPGHVLDLPAGPREVRYRLPLASTHPHHDGVAPTVRSWYIASTPSLGIEAERHPFGHVVRRTGADPRVVLEVDEEHDVAAAVEAAAGIAGARFELWVDDRDRDRVVGSALVSLGWQPVRTTTFLALVGPVAAAPGPPDLQITAVDPGEGDRLTTWASVKLRGFGDSDDPPPPDVLEAEADRWRGEAVLARYDLAWLRGEPVGVLGCYAGSDQLVFNLAVRPAWRRLGIGQALLGRWVAQGEREGCRSLLINANDGGPAAALYRAMGFVDEVHWQRCYER